jgi:hypothetical protein
MIDVQDTQPQVDVSETEFRRLLGYPRGHTPSDRALELATWARAWFAGHGRPWVCFREAGVEVGDRSLRIDGVTFDSEKLRAWFAENGVTRAVLVALSAGPECEAQAHELWQAGRPDEYFFLESFGSAVVEDLVARTNGRVCARAGDQGWRAIAHYSPGYDGWDVAEQCRLFELIFGAPGARRPPAGPLDVFPSGMLRPKKSLLAVIGLTTRPVADPPAAPCTSCSFSPCLFRRAPYRHADAAIEREVNGVDAGTPPANGALPAALYSVNARALARWARERVRFEPLDGGSLAATFRFDGTTCSSTGHPLAFDYRVVLGAAQSDLVILSTHCEPAPDDFGHEKSCSFINDADHARTTWAAAPRVLAGAPLGVIFRWPVETAASGCLCTEANRAHKWRLALETIHFALAHPSAAPAGHAGPRPAETVSSHP